MNLQAFRFKRLIRGNIHALLEEYLGTIDFETTPNSSRAIARDFGEWLQQHKKTRPLE